LLCFFLLFCHVESRQLNTRKHLQTRKRNTFRLGAGGECKQDKSGGGNCCPSARCADSNKEKGDCDTEGEVCCAGVCLAVDAKSEPKEDTPVSNPAPQYIYCNWISEEEDFEQIFSKDVFLSMSAIVPLGKARPTIPDIIRLIQDSKISRIIFDFHSLDFKPGKFISTLADTIPNPVEEWKDISFKEWSFFTLTCNQNWVGLDKSWISPQSTNGKPYYTKYVVESIPGLQIVNVIVLRRADGPTPFLIVSDAATSRTRIPNPTYSYELKSNAILGFISGLVDYYKGYKPERQNFIEVSDEIVKAFTEFAAKMDKIEVSKDEPPIAYKWQIKSFASLGLPYTMDKIKVPEEEF